MLGEAAAGSRGRPLMPGPACQAAPSPPSPRNPGRPGGWSEVDTFVPEQHGGLHQRRCAGVSCDNGIVPWEDQVKTSVIEDGFHASSFEGE